MVLRGGAIRDTGGTVARPLLKTVYSSRLVPTSLTVVSTESLERRTPTGARAHAKTPAPPPTVLPQPPEQSPRPEPAVLIHRRTHPSRDGWCPTPEPRILEQREKSLDEHQSSSTRMTVTIWKIQDSSPLAAWDYSQAP
jgi:hypothetical protein